MSSILKAINEEASEIDQLQRKLDDVESVLGTRSDRGRLYNQYVNDVTKPIKWLSNDGLVSDIHSGIRQLAEKIGMAEERMEDAEDAVREAWNQLESAVYGLAEPFEEYVRDLQYKVEEMQMDIDDKEYDKKYELQDEPLDEGRMSDLHLDIQEGATANRRKKFIEITTWRKKAEQKLKKQDSIRTHSITYLKIENQNHQMALEQ